MRGPLPKPPRRWHTRRVQARSALFDLYGDHLRPRGGAAPVAALVRLLAPVGIAAPAVRTAISRMVRQGWLVPSRLPTGPGYALTARATRRLDEAAARIYHPQDTGWDRRWHLLVIAPPDGRTARARLAAGLGYLGYGPLDASTWVSPRPAVEVDALLDELGVTCEAFLGEHARGLDGSVGLIGRAWDLPALAAAYRAFVTDLAPRVAVAADAPARDVYAARFALVHSWRTFLFRDPGLPAELLPEGWPGTVASRFFDRHATLLRPASDRFVDECLSPVPA